MQEHRKYTATFKGGQVIRRGSRTRSYEFAWALIDADGRIIRSGFSRNEGLAHSAVNTELAQFTKAQGQWRAGTHPQQNASGAQGEMLKAYFSKPARAEVAAVTAI